MGKCVHWGYRARVPNKAKRAIPTPAPDSRLRLGGEADDSQLQHIDSPMGHPLVPQLAQVHPAEGVRILDSQLRQHGRDVLRELIPATKVLHRQFPPEPRGEPRGKEKAGLLVLRERIFEVVVRHLSRADTAAAEGGGQ